MCLHLPSRPREGWGKGMDGWQSIETIVLKTISIQGLFTRLGPELSAFVYTLYLQRTFAQSVVMETDVQTL